MRWKQIYHEAECECVSRAEAEAALAEAQKEASYARQTLSDREERCERLQAKLAGYKDENGEFQRMLDREYAKVKRLEAAQKACCHAHDEHIKMLETSLAEAARMIRALEHRPARPDAVHALGRVAHDIATEKPRPDAVVCETPEQVDADLERLSAKPWRRRKLGFGLVKPKRKRRRS